MTGHIGKAIAAYAAKAYDRFHTPGHKGALCSCDITEIGDGGALFPADAVERAERDSAERYGAMHMRYLTNGSSMGIKAALWCFRGKTVLYAPGVHVAFTEGCELCGVTAVCARRGTAQDGRVYTCGGEDIPAPLSLQEAERALDECPQAAALFITSPDYLGRVTDMRIADLCRARGIALIADAAHGAHFAFAPDLQKYCFARVADMANMSAHKTLGAYTQSAVAAVNNAAYIPAFDYACKLLGTTSPNYPMLARLEESIAEASAAAQEYARLRSFRLALGEVADLLPNADYTRLCVRPHFSSARAAEEKLTEQGIVPETVIGEYVVFILTPYDDSARLARLYDALHSV